jgi:hypothetical protein
MSSHFDYTKMKQMTHPGITQMTQDNSGSFQVIPGVIPWIFVCSAGHLSLISHPCCLVIATMSLILSSIDIMGMGLTYIGISQEQQAKTLVHNKLPKGGSEKHKQDYTFHH